LTGETGGGEGFVLASLRAPSIVMDHELLSGRRRGGKINLHIRILSFSSAGVRGKLTSPDFRSIFHLDCLEWSLEDEAQRYELWTSAARNWWTLRIIQKWPIPVGVGSRRCWVRPEEETDQEMKNLKEHGL
jgi:hypothetical protein